MNTHYHVWDRSVRLFHWVNFLCIVGLIGIGLVILNSKTLGVNTDGKILLKTVHVYIGYLFAANLIWRLVWGFIGGRYSRWNALLPVGKAYGEALGKLVAGKRAGNPVQFAGHNPIARLMITFLLLLLSVQAITGLVLAGTDLYYPPFGHQIAEWVTGGTADETVLQELRPYSKENIDEQSYKAMREFRKPFIITHVYAFYTLLVAILMHVAAVVFAEIREKNGLVSAMITGNKVFAETPVDAAVNENGKPKENLEEA